MERAWHGALSSDTTFWRQRYFRRKVSWKTDVFLTIYAWNARLYVILLCIVPRCKRLRQERSDADIGLQLSFPL